MLEYVPEKSAYLQWLSETMGLTRISGYTSAVANALVAHIPGMPTCVRPSPHRH